MNADDVLFYGHKTVHSVLDGLPEDAWETPGACGWWSVKDIVSHLASYENVLVDVLGSLRGDGTVTPHLDALLSPEVDFNDDQVASRSGLSPRAALEEYDLAYAQAMTLLRDLATDQRRTAGVLPWYGNEYDLEDFLAYQYYGHKREHGAQIALFRTASPRREQA